MIVKRCQLLSVIRIFYPVVLCVLTLLMTDIASAKTIGVIMTGNISYYKDIHKAFTEGLVSEGIGQDGIEIILQTPSPEPMSWLNAVRKLIAVGSDIIVCYGASAAITAMSETSDIPIVFAGVYDPHSLGITGKNAVGISSKVPLAGLLKSMKSISGFSNVGIIYSEAEKDTILQANEVKQLGTSLGIKSVKFNVKRADDIAKISNVDALILTTGCAAMHCVNNIAAMARRYKILTGTTIGGGENSGMILTLSANPQEQGREAARIVAKVVKGVKLSAIPMGNPKKIDFIINLKEATDMGFKIPFDLLTSATRVIR